MIQPAHDFGATAAALIGWATATALEEKKKRKGQEQAQAAQVKAEADAFNEAQEAKRIAAMKQWKINSWLEGQAILNAQIERLEQQGASQDKINALKEKAKTEGLGVARNEAGILGAELREQKMKEAAQADMTEMEKWEAHIVTPEYISRQKRFAEWQREQVYESHHQGEWAVDASTTNTGGPKPLLRPVAQEPEDCGFLGYKCWGITKWVKELLFPKTPTDTPKPVLPTAPVSITHTPAITPTPLGTPISFNFLGERSSLIAENMFNDQNNGLTLPNYFYAFPFPNSHCTEFVAEVQRRSNIPILGIYQPENPVSYRTPVNQRYNSEINGEFRFRLNPSIYPTSLTNPNQVDELLFDFYKSNPNIFLSGSTVYTKAPDLFTVYGDDGKTIIDRYLKDTGVFGHSSFLIDQFGDHGPVVLEMSGPYSYTQNNGSYMGNWTGDWNYLWSVSEGSEYKIISRPLFDGNVPTQTIINGNPNGQTIATVILTEMSIVPSQPILPGEIGDYGLGFEIKQDNKIDLTEVVDQNSLEKIIKPCYINPDTIDNIVQQLYCPPVIRP